MASDDVDDRRRHPRTPLSILVQFRLNTLEDFLSEYSVNLSPGGMFIRTSSPHAEGDIVFLQFELKDGSKLIEGMGRVVRVNPPGPDAGLGIEFLNFDDESMALIEEICAARAAKKHLPS